MRIAVLGASGAVGRLLVTQALDRGLDVTAVARDPQRVPVPARPRLAKVAADVHDPLSVEAALKGIDVLVSGLGVSKGGPPGTLAAGARAAVGSGVDRIVWLGAYGTGRSAQAAGALTRALLRMIMGSELADKAAADGTVLAGGGTVFHAGPMNGGPARAHRTLPLEQAPRRLFPAGISRATVAAAMLDEALLPRHPGRVVVPLAE